MSELLAVATAIREEIVRQYRDDDRGKCRAGLPFWEEEVQPMLLAQAALAALGQHEQTQKAPPQPSGQGG